jgi:hypothetical protein
VPHLPDADKWKDVDDKEKYLTPYLPNEEKWKNAVDPRSATKSIHAISV